MTGVTRSPTHGRLLAAHGERHVIAEDAPHAEAGSAPTARLGRPPIRRHKAIPNINAAIEALGTGTTTGSERTT